MHTNKRFKDFYTPGRFTYSIEIFPPKTPAGVEALLAAFAKASQSGDLKLLDFISVTYGAQGSTRHLTADLVARIQSDFNIPTAFHFTCVGLGREQIQTYVSELIAKGVTLSVALRGDKPKDPNFEFPEDGFRYASDLVKYLHEVAPSLSLAVAGYPEVHPEALSPEADLENLKRKMENGGEIVITQLFFDNSVFYDFVDKALKLGIKAPIIPGIMPIQNFKQIEKITTLSGSRVPEALSQDLQRFANDQDAIKKIGHEFCLAQIADFKKQGVPGVHVYSLNQIEGSLGLVRSGS